MNDKKTPLVDATVSFLDQRRLKEQKDPAHDHEPFNLHPDSFKSGTKVSSGVSGHIKKAGDLHAKETEAGDSSTSDNIVYGVHNKRTGKVSGVSISARVKANPAKVAKALGHKEVGLIHKAIADHHNETWH